MLLQIAKSNDLTMKRLLTLVLFVLVINKLYCQVINSTDFEKPPASIDEVIKQLGNSDTAVFYYNERWQLVKPICATVFRFSRVDTVLQTFTGEFTDYYSYDSSKAIEGNYLKGKKEGMFKFYFPNGQLAQSGNYVNDKKGGMWQYFYEDGVKRQILDFQENEILVKEFWNEEGKKLVDSGIGEWFGYESAEKFIKTSGEIFNGRKNGTWKNMISSRNMITNIAKYKDGKLISGKIISVVGGTESYKDTIYCSIEKPLPFLTAELFQVNQCYKNQKNNWEFAKYPGGMERFYSEIKEKLVLTGEVGRKGVIRIQTTIDTDGKMTNFKLVSSIGYESDLIRVLQTMDNWTPTKINGKPTTQTKLISFEIR
jgi:hypothetical protein